MNLPNLKLTKNDFACFNEALRKEWLITNGMGGYASSTPFGVNTRKYHGLLVAALDPPGNRNVCLLKLDEEIDEGTNVYLLGTNEFGDTFFPRGFMHLTEFSLTPFPKHTFSAGNVKLEKTVFMPQGKNVTVLLYRVQNNNDFDVNIRLTPMLACRHIHSIMEKAKSQAKISQQKSRHNELQVTVNRSDVSVKFTIRATSGVFVEKPNWIERIIYREDIIRTETGIEDGYQPGFFEFAIAPRTAETLAVVAAASGDFQQNLTDMEAVGDTAKACQRTLTQELQRKEAFLNDFFSSHRAMPDNNVMQWILSAADSFVVKSSRSRKAVIAGYHWYEPWGRDTFISLPGLMLATGRFEDAEGVLETFGEKTARGLIPNYIDDRSGEAVYNTVDASLWYVNAVLQLLKYTGDFEFVQARLWENLKSIIRSHIEGTDHGIHMDSDGLISHGPRLTWMDAEVDGTAMTPREGKAVEIQALWYNALRVTQLLAAKYGEDALAADWGRLAQKARTSFNLAYWNEKRNCLFDVLEANGHDESVRPNQMIAASLDFAILEKDRSAKVLDVAQRDLLTPCGLRTLAPYEPNYRGIYYGSRRSRDEAYHNGTVWPWLFGPFASALLKVKGRSKENLNYLRHILEALFSEQISRAGLGTIAEIFSGDAPHTPRGCIAQAWSVGEPLRAYVEEVLRIRPPFESQVLSVQPET